MAWGYSTQRRRESRERWLELGRDLARSLSKAIEEVWREVNHPSGGTRPELRLAAWVWRVVTG